MSHTMRWVLVVLLATGCDDGGGRASADAAVDAGDGSVLDAGEPSADTGSDGDGGPDAEPEPCDPTVERCPPANPVCYTPCRGDVRAADGTVRRCQQDGLMEGCLAGSVCHLGSCVPATPMNAAVADPGRCEVETDCPDFQTCIISSSGRGRCYSDCAADGDCDTGSACHRRVCRPRCTMDRACGAGNACQEGVCQPLAAAGEAAPRRDDAAFAVSPPAMRFGTGAPEGALTLHNRGTHDLVLTVEKVEQATFPAGGGVEVETDDPLPWLTIDGERGPVEVAVPAGETRTLSLGSARNPSHARWEGRLRITAEGLGAREVRLVYTHEVAGRWVGSAYAFGNFDDGARPLEGRFPLEAWRADRDDLRRLDDVPNAFLQAWGRFRTGRLGLDEMAALIDATLTGSWDFPRVRQLCREAGFDAAAACAPFGGSGSRSVIPYASDVRTQRIPTGAVDLDFALHLREASGAPCGGGACLVGRIDTASALQYGGDPEVVLRFVGDPTACAREGDLGCLAFVERLEADIAVGGRYAPADDCAPGFDAVAVPWLVPGFDPPAGDRSERVECHDARRPLAGANPVPDGQARRRRLELIDGVMVNQQVMTLLLRETVDAFHGGAPLASYLYVVLERAADGDEDLDTAGNRPEAGGDTPRGAAPTCAPWLVEAVTGRAQDLDALSSAAASALAAAAVTGRTGVPAELPDDEELHTLCVWDEDQLVNSNDGSIDQARTITRQLIDAGPDDDRPCFPGAQVVYFTVPVGFDVPREQCNRTVPETCLDALVTVAQRGDVPLRISARSASLFPDPAPNVSFDLAYRCDDPQRASCDDDRFDLRNGKTFFVLDAATSFFSPLDTDIAQAFRYRTRLVRPDGARPGFAPEICRTGGDLLPYCYDPEGIAEVRDRVDCALALYHGALAGAVTLDAGARQTLRTFLQRSFSALEAARPDRDPSAEHGFERLYAELLLLLGDDAYAAAFASRFDLAGQSGRAFEGGRFEDGGVDLSGAAGYELHALHQAAQYYELVLDRFYGMSGWLWQSLAAGAGDRYVTAATVNNYLDRVIRASTQTAAAWGAVAERYQGLGRPDLAERVLERAYTRAYQESLVLGAFLRAVMEAVSPAAVADVARAVQDAQRRYRVALLDMKSRYRRIAGGTDVFGLPPDYIPAPALDENTHNAFEVMLARAREQLAAAAADETAAIASRRSFAADQAAFQGELVTLRNSYEAELGRLCGTFLGDDGRTYPAVARYAHLHPDLAELDDPCGAAGNGALWLAGGDLQGFELTLQRVRAEASHILASVADAKEWVAKQCELRREDVDTFLRSQGAVDGLETAVDAMQATITQLDKVHDAITEGTSRFGEISEANTIGGLVTRVFAFGAFATSAFVNLAVTSVLEGAIVANNTEVRRLEREYEGYQIGRECDLLQAEQVFTLRGLHRDLLLAEIDILTALWDVQVAFGEIQRLVNERNRLETEWREAEQLAVNAAAAASDPNIRIYKNDAILNADRSFERAARAAWAATRMYEYYTASSYPAREALFLARTVRVGDINLVRYVDDLEDAFLDFEQQLGNPDTRVLTVSVRDDVLQVPRYAVDGSHRVLTAQERIEWLREALQDPVRRDRDGALSVSFSTGFDQLSPRTTNHKILFIEVEVFGRGTGDDVGRLYLRQRGTGVVQGTDGDRRFFTLPARTAVMNPFFNGRRAFGQDADGAIAGPTRSIYRSYRFRERPLVQTDWELVLDQRREAVNRDIDLAGIDDIVVYVYYTDFTRD